MRKIAAYVLSALGAGMILAGVWSAGNGEGVWWKFLLSAVVVLLAAILVAPHDTQKRL